MLHIIFLVQAGQAWLEENPEKRLITLMNPTTRKWAAVVNAKRLIQII
jgi:hypothetical protein